MHNTVTVTLTRGEVDALLTSTGEWLNVDDMEEFCCPTALEKEDLSTVRRKLANAVGVPVL